MSTESCSNCGLKRFLYRTVGPRGQSSYSLTIMTATTAWKSLKWLEKTRYCSHYCNKEHLLAHCNHVVSSSGVSWNNYVLQIEIMGFPPHTTHLLQPLDVGIFNHVKKSYTQICVSSGMRSSKSIITKSYFPITWKNAIEQGATPSVIQSAFRRSGVFPFDPCAVDSSHIKKRKYVLTMCNFLCHIYLYAWQLTLTLYVI